MSYLVMCFIVMSYLVDIEIQLCVMSYLVGIENRKGAEAAGTYKHMAEGHQKREKGEMSVSSRGKFNVFTSIVYEENAESTARNQQRKSHKWTRTLSFGFS